MSNKNGNANKFAELLGKYRNQTSKSENNAEPKRIRAVVGRDGESEDCCCATCWCLACLADCSC